MTMEVKVTTIKISPSTLEVLIVTKSQAFQIRRSVFSCKADQEKSSADRLVDPPSSVGIFQLELSQNIAARDCCV